MRSDLLGLIIGGGIPAMLYGLTNLAGKAGMQAGIGSGVFLLSAVVGVAMGGVLILGLQPEPIALSWRTFGIAVAYGLTWSVASGLALFAHVRYGVAFSKLVPLFNLNTLVSVALLLVVFREWEGLSVVRLLLGTVLTMIGATLVALA